MTSCDPLTKEAQSSASVRSFKKVVERAGSCSKTEHGINLVSQVHHANPNPSLGTTAVLHALKENGWLLLEQQGGKHGLIHQCARLKELPNRQSQNGMLSTSLMLTSPNLRSINHHLIQTYSHPPKPNQIATFRSSNSEMFWWPMLSWWILLQALLALLQDFLRQLKALSQVLGHGQEPLLPREGVMLVRCIPSGCLFPQQLKALGS